MTAIDEKARTYTHADWTDFVHTGPGTLAGRYMRGFWQPVSTAEDLRHGRAVPIRIMSEDFTLYRGENGAPHLLAFRCAHRGTQLSTGWVEGDDLRCFYHGWKYDASGQCIEQPAEPEPFCQKIRIRSYPIEEYLGLIFAYLGDAEPPPLPRYPDWENAGVALAETYTRPCNYFQDLENDPVHGAFVHSRGQRRPAPSVTAEESEWGMTAHLTYPDGSVRITQWGMPNLHVVQTPPPAQPADWRNTGQMDDESGPGSEWRDTIHMKVPVDDTTEASFRVHFARVSGEAAHQYRERYDQWRAQGARISAPELSAAILRGEMHVRDTFDRTDFYRTTVEDDVAQLGQGPIADRTQDHLGKSDVTVVLFRKLWERELRALAEGRPLKQWKRTERTLARDPGGLARARQRVAP